LKEENKIMMTEKQIRAERKAARKNAKENNDE
jgi:hypothetical protein